MHEWAGRRQQDVDARREDDDDTGCQRDCRGRRARALWARRWQQHTASTAGGQAHPTRLGWRARVASMSWRHARTYSEAAGLERAAVHDFRVASRRHFCRRHTRVLGVSAGSAQACSDCPRWLGRCSSMWANGCAPARVDLGPEIIRLTSGMNGMPPPARIAAGAPRPTRGRLRDLQGRQTVPTSK